MKSDSNRPAVRQFGQLSLFSSFRSNHSSKDCKDVKSKPLKPCISLSAFLDRKLEKAKCSSTQEKPVSFSSVINAFAPEKNKGLELEKCRDDLLLSGTVFEQLKHKREENSFESDGHVQSGEFQFKCTDDGEDSKKRKNPFEVYKDKKANYPRHLVVLGDDPKPKMVRRQNMTNKRLKPGFNHYANGSGWWDCNREGIDSDEVGCDDPWEGMGTTTLGGLEWH